MEALITPTQPESDDAALEREARVVIDAGIAAAREIADEQWRLPHLTSWAYRLSLLDPDAAARLFEESPPTEMERVHAALTVLDDTLRRGRIDLQPRFEATLELLADMPSSQSRLEVFNALSETALRVGSVDGATGSALLKLLRPHLERISDDPEDAASCRALAASLLGEAFDCLDDPEGQRLIEEVIDSLDDLPVADSVRSFLAPARLAKAPAESIAMANAIEEPTLRFQTRLQLLADEQLTADSASELIEGSAQDIPGMCTDQRAEMFVRIAEAAHRYDSDRARELFQYALESADHLDPQFRALSQAAVGAAIAEADADWGAEVLDQAVASAREEEEISKRLVTLVTLAREIARSRPEAAQELFDEALAEADGLNSLWEFAHVTDVIFGSHAEEDELLDTSGAKPLLDRALTMVRDDDPRVPGVFGLGEIAQILDRVDPETARTTYERWVDATREMGDFDAMAQAAAGLHAYHPEKAQAAFVEISEALLKRMDCPGMSDFCRSIALAAPDLALQVAEGIPSPGERERMRQELAVFLYGHDEQLSRRLISELAEPEKRSQAWLEIADRMLGTQDRPQPPINYEDTCCYDPAWLPENADAEATVD